MTPDPPVILDVGQLETLLSDTFNIGLDVGAGSENVDLVGLRLSKALLGAAEAQALAAESIAIEGGVASEKITEAEGLALHAGRVQRRARSGVSSHRPGHGYRDRPGSGRARPGRTPP